MSKEETAEIKQHSDSVVSLCTEKDRLVKRMVARILNCEDQAEKRTKMLLLSSLISRVESCSSYSKGKASCDHCRQINIFRKRILELTMSYDRSMTQINGRLSNVVTKLSDGPAVHPELQIQGRVG
ncbi:hypothetical protein HQ586_04215 [Candidatus Bathyarchaeota archaeon]|nr:hypothetical protein [Candidatus Bathyarchaeota archaeon]